MTDYQDNSKKYKELRINYPVFIYEDFSITYGEENNKNRNEKYIKFQFFFSCGKERFTPYQLIYTKDFFISPFNNLETQNTKKKTCKESCCNTELSENSEDSLSVLLPFAFNLGLIELISYWKACCSPKILIKCGHLNDEQKKFWKKLWFNGLGEFFYLNNVRTNINDFVDIVCESDLQYKQVRMIFKDEYIVPVGGGKDSVVSLELLRAKGKNITPMVINNRGATKSCIERAGFKEADTIEIKRIIDENLLELNKKGYLNGHTPFSAMLAFTTLICAVLSGKKYIALSNENSANEATVYKNNDISEFNGVNHQYSKSLEFENDFRAYYKEYLCKDIEYFSFLRPISELQIARIFSFLDYSDVFKSCNAGSKQDIWCGNCPKCLFAYIIMSPFIEPDKLNKVFGKNMFEDEKLLTYFKELTGENEVKPFECVGTVDEVNSAIAQRIKKFGIKSEEILLNHWDNSPFKAKYNGTSFSQIINKEDNNNNLPEDLNDSFANFFVLTVYSRIIHLLKDETIAIMGLGREGQSTLKLLNKILPGKQLVLYDENQKKFEEIKDSVKNHRCYCSKNDLIRINNECSLIFLTPGMAPKDYPQLNFNKLTNQCDIFLRVVGELCIGVSGTKGKSTTSSLIYHIIKQKNDNVLLAGNIGVPFFDVLDKINPQTMIVLELSCHQLQLIKKSPHISVLLNLYEEHLDHYKDFTDYQNAKLNLLFKADNHDKFIYNADDRIINDSLNGINTQVDMIGFHLSDYVFKESKTLKGDHNKYNILAVLNAVKLTGIEEKDALNFDSDFRTLPHRMEFIGNKDGVNYYDDSISTIPQATLAAVKSLPNVQTLILGGMDRGIDYSALNELQNIATLKNIAFVGKAGKRMCDVITKNINKNGGKTIFNVLICDDWKEIVRFCKKNTHAGYCVLLSPAASSYDQFRNFEHRGNYFKELVFNS